MKTKPRLALQIEATKWDCKECTIKNSVCTEAASNSYATLGVTSALPQKRKKKKWRKRRSSRSSGGDDKRWSRRKRKRLSSVLVSDSRCLCRTPCKLKVSGGEGTQPRTPLPPTNPRVAPLRVCRRWRRCRILASAARRSIDVQLPIPQPSHSTFHSPSSPRTTLPFPTPSSSHPRTTSSTVTRDCRDSVDIVLERKREQEGERENREEGERE